MIKICSKCKREKRIAQKRKYYNDNKVKQLATQKEKYHENRDEILKSRQLHRDLNREEFQAYGREYRRRNRDWNLKRLKDYRELNKEKLDVYNKKYAKENIDIIRKRRRDYQKKYTSTPKGRAASRISRAIRSTLKGNKNYRSWESIVGYTKESLIKRLRLTMPDGFSWSDFMEGDLHIDHIIPISKFNFEKPEDDDFKRCWSLKNLQLLPATENMFKSNKLEKPFQPSLIFGGAN